MLQMKGQSQRPIDILLKPDHDLSVGAPEVRGGRGYVLTFGTPYGSSPRIH